MNKKEIIDILNTIYIRFMRLEFSYKTFNTIIYSPTIINDYPNLCWCMQISFATDAYTTIDGLIHSGRYSFSSLIDDNDDIKKKYNEIMKEIEKIIPDIRNIRNQMFCHLVQKQSDDAIQQINIHCYKILDCLKKLHAFCCKVYNINELELNGYNNITFNSLNKELNEFNDLLMNGSMSDFYKMLNEIHNGKSLRDLEKNRHKLIKPE